MKGFFVKILLLILLCVQPALAQNLEKFNQANQYYNDGKFNDAINLYEEILDDGEHSAEVYFNLGNAHYKLNNIAPSVFYFEKALQLKPNDREIKNNLAFAQNMTVDAIVPQPKVGIQKLVNDFTNTFSYDTWALTAVGLVILFTIVFVMYYFSKATKSKRLLFVGSIAAAALALLCVTIAFHSFNLKENDRPAIVFAPEGQVKSEPNLRGTLAFTLHEGTKVQVLDTLDNWKKIELADGKSGWIDEDAIKLLSEY